MAAPKTRSRTRSKAVPQDNGAGDVKEVKDVKDAQEQAKDAVTEDAKKNTVDQAEIKALRDKQKAEAKAEKDKERRAAESKARQAKIDAGDLIIRDGKEYERGTKETKVFGQIAQIVDLYRESEYPLIFTEVVEEIGARYPEDLVPAMHALEHLGLVQRYDARTTGEATSRRGTAAYLWVAED